MSFLLYISLFGKKTISRVIVWRLRLCVTTYTLHIYMYISSIVRIQRERDTCASIYVYAHKYTFVLGKTETTPTPQFYPWPLETCQHFSFPDQNCQDKTDTVE